MRPKKRQAHSFLPSNSARLRSLRKNSSCMSHCNRARLHPCHKSRIIGWTLAPATGPGYASQLPSSGSYEQPKAPPLMDGAFGYCFCHCFCDQREQLAPPQVVCDQREQLAPPQVVCDQREQLAPPQVVCDQREQSAPPQVVCDQREQSAPPQVVCDQREQSAPPQVVASRSIPNPDA